MSFHIIQENKILEKKFQIYSILQLLIKPLHTVLDLEKIFGLDLDLNYVTFYFWRLFGKESGDDEKQVLISEITDVPDHTDLFSSLWPWKLG